MRAIAITLVLLALCGATAAGQVFTDLDRHVLVMFRSGYLTEEPHVEHGVLQLVNGTSKTALAPITWVTSLRPLYRKGICGYSIEGPWSMTITTERATAQLVADIAARPEVLRCTAVNFDDPIEPPLLGEATKAWFPPEAAQSAGLFCKFEEYFDFPRPSEEPFPTLDSLAVDACGWYREVFEGQYPNPYYPRDIDLPPPPASSTPIPERASAMQTATRPAVCLG